MSENKTQEEIALKVDKEELKKEEKEEKKEEKEEKKEEKIEDKKDDEEEEEDGYTKTALRVLEILNKEDPEAPELTDHHTVLVAVFINKLDALDTAAGKVYLDIGLTLWYKDKTLIGKSGDEFDKDKVFKPELEIEGSVDFDAVGEMSWWMLDMYSPHGIVSTYQKYRGYMTVPMDLHQFPFDQQVVSVKIYSNVWGDDCLTLKNFTKPESIEAMTTNGGKMKEWLLLKKPDIYESKYFNVEDQRDVSQLIVDFQYKRKTGFYVQNIVILVMMIQIMGWSIFFCPQENVDSRSSITITLFLAAVAFNFIVVGVTPRISHSTYLSRYFFSTYAVIVAEVVESVIASLIQKSNPEAAQIFDWVCLAVFIMATVAYSLAFTVAGYKKGVIVDTTPTKEKTQ